jgi:hypothetical protein
MGLLTGYNVRSVSCAAGSGLLRGKSCSASRTRRVVQIKRCSRERVTTLCVQEFTFNPFRVDKR